MTKVFKLTCEYFCMCVWGREGHNVNSWRVISLIFRPLNNLEQTLKLKMNHKMSYSTQLVYVCKCENCVCLHMCMLLSVGPGFTEQKRKVVWKMQQWWQTLCVSEKCIHSCHRDKSQDTFCNCD